MTLDVERLAAALNDAQIQPDEIRLGRDLAVVAARVARAYRPAPTLDVELLAKALHEHDEDLVAILDDETMQCDHDGRTPECVMRAEKLAEKYARLAETTKAGSA